MSRAFKHVKTREKHGYAGTPTYRAWHEMKKRCYNPNVIRYPKYGGRGIEVCERWRESFSAFLADMGEKPGPEYSMDRVDVNGNYEPNNCRWATRQEQMRNKTNNHFVECFGQRKTIVEWSEETGIPHRVIQQRLNRDKLTPEQALSTMREPGRPGRYRKRLYE